jgi:hypothetical protein
MVPLATIILNINIILFVKKSVKNERINFIVIREYPSNLFVKINYKYMYKILC